MIDSHCHLDAPEFAEDRGEVIARARRVGVTGIVIPAVSAAGWPALQALCAQEADLHPAYGLHPMFLSEHGPEHLDQLRALLTRSPAVAVGESGLDYYIDDLDRDLQQHYFEGQLRIAREFDLPVILHARRAHEAVLHTVRRLQPLRGVIHSYAGSAEQARQFIDLGFMLGFGGPITYPRARRLRELIRTLPLDSILAETDAPDQPLHGHQGQRNEPALLLEVITTMAELRGESERAIAAATAANAGRMVGFSRAQGIGPRAQ